MKISDVPALDSSDHFFTEDLVWPDPENVFPKTSGVKPGVLTAELKHLNMGGVELMPKNRCQAALVVRKKPRPKSLPWNVVIIESDPPVIEADDVEEYLVHDPLFVEFFNAYLALPCFPEVVYFNIESGGFEVVTDAKLRLAQQIKEAVRSQRTKVDIYENVQQHAFSDIPVFPIEDAQGPEQEQIDRTFDVMALNKEQGILWVKTARLPKFLESDFYFQYRLAKVISQASIFNNRGEFVVMKIDYTTKSKTKKKLVEVQPPTQEELIMKEMFVSFGDLKGEAKEAWFTQAKKHLKTEVTFSTLNQGHSIGAAGADAPPSVTPSKKSSVFNSHYFGVYAPGLIGPNETQPPIYDSSLEKEGSVLRDRPFTPRPSDRIHAATTLLRAKLSSDPGADEEMISAGNVVFMWPKQDQQNIAAESDLEDQAGREMEFAKRIREHQIIDQIYNDGSWEEGDIGHIVLKSVDELGAVIVGAVMKKTVSQLLQVNEEAVVSDPRISEIYPSMELTCVSVDKLNLCVVVEMPETGDDQLSAVDSGVDGLSTDGELPDKEPVHIKWRKPIIKSAEEDSEEESLLDSDEDFEERDQYFRRRKDKWHSLTSLKGIQAFKKFLVGTQGEKYWELWIDIDKGRLIRSEEEKQKYILHMRDKYYKKGAQFELSAENKRTLKLENLSQWTPEYLFQVQANVLEPLVLYWAPRYLLSHLLQTCPEKYHLYNQLKMATFDPASDPYPNTQELLPLRPKSCCPNNRLGFGVGEMSNNTYMTETTPQVGNRRIYSQDTINRLANTPTAKYLRKMEAKTKPAMPQKHQIPDTFRDFLLAKKASSGRASVKKSKSALSPTSDVLSQLSISTTLPSVLKNGRSTITDRLPCPYNSTLAVLFGSKGEHLATKMSTNTLPPLVKAEDFQGDKCKGIKSAPIRKSDSQESTNYTFFRQDSKETSKSCQMYQSSQGQMSTGDAESLECEFLNSMRLDMLLQALHHEQDSGRAIRKFIISSKREDWLNNLDFWEKVQAYRKLFYKDKLDLHLITKHARSIFAQCIVEGAPQSINVSEHMKLFILDHLNPPYEDLFDRAEEKALAMLFEAYVLYMQQDAMSYCEVERTLKESRLETRNTNILNLQKLGLIKERPLTPDDPMEGYVDPVYDDSILQMLPEEFRNWNMAKLAQNKLELEYFRQFLIPRYAEIDLKCWMDMEAWRRTAPDDSSLRDQRAIEIKKNYLNKKYFFGLNSPAGIDGQNKVMEAGGGWGKFLEDKPHFNTILKAQKYVRARLENKHLPYFLLSGDFQERHLIDSSIITEEEDAFNENRKRSVAIMKVISGGEEAFDAALSNKEKLLLNLDDLELTTKDRSTLHLSRIDVVSSRTSERKSERSVVSDVDVDANSETQDMKSKRLKDINKTQM
ncbi:hypothetical protein BsWGS_02506 [Bradybaena similaris]